MVREKMTLPFEVTYSERPSKKSKTMKRLAVLLKPENVDGIVSMLNSSVLEATIYDVEGATQERQRVSSGRCSSTIDLAYTTRKLVATVVNSDDVDVVVERMKNALGGDKAVVVVSPVDNLVML